MKKEDVMKALEAIDRTLAQISLRGDGVMLMAEARNGIGSVYNALKREEKTDEKTEEEPWYCREW